MSVTAPLRVSGGSRGPRNRFGATRRACGVPARDTRGCPSHHGAGWVVRIGRVKRCGRRVLATQGLCRSGRPDQSPPLQCPCYRCPSRCGRRSEQQLTVGGERWCPRYRPRLGWVTDRRAGPAGGVRRGPSGPSRSTAGVLRSDGPIGVSSAAPTMPSNSVCSNSSSSQINAQNWAPTASDPRAVPSLALPRIVSHPLPRSSALLEVCWLV